MTNYIKAFLFFFLFFPFVLPAQEIVFGYSLVYGKYQLDDFKSMQQKGIRFYQDLYGKDFNYKSTETFPDGWIHNAYVGTKFSFHEVGLQYNYLTTGGRNHLADYSGELKNDHILSGNALGVYYKLNFLSLPLSKDVHLTAHAGTSVGMIYNKIKNNITYYLENPLIDYYGREFQNTDESIKLRSTNWYIQPNLGVQFWFKNLISLNLNAGYMFDSPGNIKTADRDTQYIQTIQYNSEGKISGMEYGSTPGKEYNVGVDWSGLRLSVGIGFAFSISK
ncbi:MAG: hypothetical protein LIO93_06530 [Bacteroidales bacterium]|nr:hypothetical protein [Bacteroidales bacterium]